MDKQELIFEKVLKLGTIADRPLSKANALIGTMIDAAFDAKREDVLRHVAVLAETVSRKGADEGEIALLDYFLGNLWSNIRHIAGPHPSGDWEWEQIERENEVVCLRRAIRSAGFDRLPAIRRCQIHTNLGNCYNNTGRFVEAVESWNQAALIEPSFGMATGNRALGLWTYAKTVYDPGHAVVLSREAWRGLDPSKLAGLEPGAADFFAKLRVAIQKAVRGDVLRGSLEMDEFPLGRSKAEKMYRRWCLKNRLFLNPLNDVGPFAIAARDILTLPSIVVKIGEGPRFHGFFNQIKEEFCAARWLAYEGMVKDSKPHFADRGVLLYNTLDYPKYSVRSEKMKLAFRSLYSQFDKIAFFLNAYLALKIPDRNVSFRGLWYIEQNRKKGIRTEFKARENLPLRGLYWLGKDLYEDRPEFRAVIDPGAQRLNEIRNHIEHKYLKLHDYQWAGPGTDRTSFAIVDELAESMYESEFELMTMRLLTLVRSTIIYLSLGVHREERFRAKKLKSEGVVGPMFLDVWEDEWKS